MVLTKSKKLKVAIIGGGITGLSLAYYLNKNKYDITIFEQDTNMGGLAGWTNINNVPIEKFYHHFFTSDIDLINLAKELKIIDKISYYPSTVGFYINNKLLPFTSPTDLLKFDPIPLVDRIKMGLLTLYFTKKKSWEDLERYSCKQYFSKIKANKLYDNIWKPLLKLKFGASEPEIPATFLWGRINPRGRSRKGLGEQLGYFQNSFSVLFDKLHQRISLSDVKTVTEKVILIKESSAIATVETNKNKYRFDIVIFTGSSNTLQSIYPQIPDNINNNLNKIKYQAINCMILESKKQISPYYWLNIVDTNICFGGFIEHTNLVPKKTYKNHIVYIFNYLGQNNPIYISDPETVKKRYLNDVKKIFPSFNTSDIVNYQLFRNAYATPIYDAHYSKKQPPFKIGEHIFLANTSQVYPEDRNVSNGIKLAKKIISEYFK